MSAPPPVQEEYGHRAVFMSADKPGSPVWFVLTVETIPLRPDTLTEARDAIATGSHLFIIARDAESRDAAAAAVTELIQAPAASIH